jgi:K+-sensing histidine kinase KdpD
MGPARIRTKRQPRPTVTAPAALGAVAGSSGPQVRGVSRRRQLIAAGLATIGLPLLTAVAAAVGATTATHSILLVYLLAVVLVCAVGGLLPGLLAAVLAFLLANWFLTAPVGTLSVRSPTALTDLVVFLLVAAVVSITVEIGARDRASAARHRVQTQLVGSLGAAELRGTTPEQILDQVRTLYGMTTVTLLDRTGQTVVAVAGPAPENDAPSLAVPVGGQVRLRGYGPPVFGEDQLVLAALAEAAVRVWDRQELAAEAARAKQLAQSDRVRSALLTAVSHDLRTPIASIKTAASGLRQDDIALSADDEAELLAAIEEGADRLAALVDNLLAMSRINAGALTVELRPVAVEDVVDRAVAAAPPATVQLSLEPGLPPAQADAGLLERVLANLVDNALRFSPAEAPVQLRAQTAPGTPDRVQLRVVDHGPGVPTNRWPEMFLPFQRLGDTSRGGIGLGLAIARGLTEAMGGTLTPEHTAGGGLTMVLTVPAQR